MIPNIIITSEEVPVNDAAIYSRYIIVHPDRLDELIEGIRAMLINRYTPRIFNSMGRFEEWQKQLQAEKQKVENCNKK